MKTELILFDSFENSIYRILTAFVSLIVFDLIWFTLTKHNIYSSITKKPNIYSAIFVYFIISITISLQEPKSYNEALIYGLLVGFIIYSVFNFTSHAIFNNWSLSTAIADTIAGTINCGIAASIVYFLSSLKNGA